MKIIGVISIVDAAMLCFSAELTSKTKARQLIRSGGLRINGKQETDETLFILQLEDKRCFLGWLDPALYNENMLAEIRKINLDSDKKFS
jgi:hypothetical protein